MDAELLLGFLALFVTILGTAFSLGGKLSGINAKLEMLTKQQSKTDGDVTALNSTVVDVELVQTRHEEKIQKNAEAINRLEKHAGMA